MVTSKIKYSLYFFDESKKQLSKKMIEVIKTNVQHLSTIISEISNKTLTKEIAKKNGNNKSKEETGELLLGGHDVKCIWRFSISKKRQYIIKVFHKNSISIKELVWHYFSVRNFKQKFKEKNYLIDDDQKVIIYILDVFGLGYYSLPRARFLFLVQEYSQHQQLNECFTDTQKPRVPLKAIFQEITNQGFIIDPSPGNWCIKKSSEEELELEYFDLLWENHPQTKQKVNDFLKKCKFNLLLISD
ncbi:MAG: hypothetical protein GF308_05580 [Candidatus Heimdallarchaeota archaeon]|nr:hypothetical protein [Candidatus Heimdallarchaeota archaeon]